MKTIVDAWNSLPESNAAPSAAWKADHALLALQEARKQYFESVKEVLEEAKSAWSLEEINEAFKGISTAGDI